MFNILTLKCCSLSEIIHLRPKHCAVFWVPWDSLTYRSHLWGKQQLLLLIISFKRMVGYLCVCTFKIQKFSHLYLVIMWEDSKYLVYIFLRTLIVNFLDFKGLSIEFFFSLEICFFRFLLYSSCVCKLVTK